MDVPILPSDAAADSDAAERDVFIPKNQEKGRARGREKGGGGGG